MTRSAALLCLVALLGCVSSITGASIFDLFDLQRDVAVPAPKNNGVLFCNGATAEFRLPDFDIYQYAFVNPYSPGNARVESVQIGLRKVAGCTANRFPTNTNNPLLQKSYAIIVNYTQCGWQDTEDHEFITYRNTAVATLLYPPPIGTVGVIRRKTFHIPMTCVGSSVGEIKTLGNFFREIAMLNGVGSVFDVSFGATSRQEVRDFGQNIDTNFIILIINLDKQYREFYSIIGDKCWATSTTDPASSPRYEFVKSRGYNEAGEDFVVINNTLPYEVTYEIADFQFEGIETPTLYFHCEVNICLKSNDARCQPGPPGPSGDFIVPKMNRLAPVRNIAADYRLSSAAEERSSIPARVKVNSLGRPSRI